MRLDYSIHLFLFTGSAFLSAIFLALATYQSLYPLTLFVPGLLYLLQVSTRWSEASTQVTFDTWPGLCLGERRAWLNQAMGLQFTLTFFYLQIHCLKRNISSKCRGGSVKIQTKKCLISKPLFLSISTVAKTEYIPPFIEIGHMLIILTDFIIYLCVDVMMIHG